jgi:anti-sigma B factor antagonist
MGAKSQLNLETRRDTDRVVIVMEGELDMANAPALQDAIESEELAGAENVVLDLQGLTFLDSTGLRVILAARELCWRRSQEFAVTPGSAQVQRLLSVTGVGGHLRTIATAGELLA